MRNKTGKWQPKDFFMAVLFLLLSMTSLVAVWLWPKATPPLSPSLLKVPPSLTARKLPLTYIPAPSIPEGGSFPVDCRAYASEPTPKNLEDRAYEALLARHWQEARALYKALLRYAPSHPGFRYHYGVALFYTGARSEAHAIFTQLLEEYPNMGHTVGPS